MNKVLFSESCSGFSFHAHSWAIAMGVAVLALVASDSSLRVNALFVFACAGTWITAFGILVAMHVLAEPLTLAARRLTAWITVAVPLLSAAMLNIPAFSALCIIICLGATAWVLARWQLAMPLASEGQRISTIQLG